MKGRECGVSGQYVAVLLYIRISIPHTFELVKQNLKECWCPSMVLSLTIMCKVLPGFCNHGPSKWSEHIYTEPHQTM